MCLWKDVPTQGKNLLSSSKCTIFEAVEFYHFTFGVFPYLSLCRNHCWQRTKSLSGLWAFSVISSLVGFVRQNTEVALAIGDLVFY